MAVGGAPGRGGGLRPRGVAWAGWGLGGCGGPTPSILSCPGAWRGAAGPERVSVARDPAPVGESAGRPSVPESGEGLLGGRDHAAAAGAGLGRPVPAQKALGVGLAAALAAGEHAQMLVVHRTPPGKTSGCRRGGGAKPDSKAGRGPWPAWPGRLAFPLGHGPAEPRGPAGLTRSLRLGGGHGLAAPTSPTQDSTKSRGGPSMTQGGPHSYAVIRPRACKKVSDRSVAPRRGTLGADSKAHPTRWVYEWERVRREVGGVC